MPVFFIVVLSWSQSKKPLSESPDNGFIMFKFLTETLFHRQAVLCSGLIMPSIRMEIMSPAIIAPISRLQNTLLRHFL